MGTINKWKDRDKGWSCEMAVPISSLEENGVKFAKKTTPWKILIARYNYSRYLDYKELTAFVPQKKANFHKHEEYGIINFVK